MGRAFLRDDETLVTEDFILEVYVPCENLGLLGIFNKERCNMGLEGHDIQLLVPENGRYFNSTTLADAGGSCRTGYDVTLYTRNIENSDLSYRSTICHELAHIKHGDVDRNLPKIIKWFYGQFIEEPRARSYE